MPQHHSRLRLIHLVTICLLLSAAGWATGQSRFARERAVTFNDDYPGTVSVATRAVGGSTGGGELLVELKGRADDVYSREQTVLKVTAIDEDGILIRHAVLSVDFGDGTVEEFPLDRRAQIEHEWKKRGSYKLEFGLVDQEGRNLRGKMRVRVGGPLRTFLQVIGETDIEIEEENRYRFVAFAREGRTVQGAVSIDWGDGETTFVSNFGGDVVRAHTYAEEGTYEIQATLLYADGAKETSRSFQVKATETGGPIDLREATIAINSDRNIANFRVTSTVTNVTISPSLICIFHTKAGGWPVRDGLEGNPWVAAFVNGKLHAGTYEWLRPGQVCKNITKANIGPHVKHGTLGGWAPTKGETLYFFVSTHARLDVSSSNERSEPYAKVWPH